MTLETYIRFKPPAGVVAKIAADQVIFYYKSSFVSLTVLADQCLLLCSI